MEKVCSCVWSGGFYFPQRVETSKKQPYRWGALQHDSSLVASVADVPYVWTNLLRFSCSVQVKYDVNKNNKIQVNRYEFQSGTSSHLPNTLDFVALHTWVSHEWCSSTYHLPFWQEMEARSESVVCTFEEKKYMLNMFYSRAHMINMSVSKFLCFGGCQGQGCKEITRNHSRLKKLGVRLR